MGAFRLVRHPLCSALSLAAFWFTLLSANWVVGLIALCLVMDMVLVRARGEDGFPAAQFGTRFSEYARRTPAFVPRARWHDS